MSSTRHLPHIKLFRISGGLHCDPPVEQLVNKFIVDTFGRTGDIPKISHSGDHISVIWNELEETTYQPPPRPHITNIIKHNP